MIVAPAGSEFLQCIAFQKSLRGLVRVRVFQITMKISVNVAALVTRITIDS